MEYKLNTLYEIHLKPLLLLSISFFLGSGIKCMIRPEADQLFRSYSTTRKHGTNLNVEIKFGTLLCIVNINDLALRSKFKTALYGDALSHFSLSALLTIVNHCCNLNLMTGCLQINHQQIISIYIYFDMKERTR